MTGVNDYFSVILILVKRKEDYAFYIVLNGNVVTSTPIIWKWRK